jgi:trehalose synthase
VELERFQELIGSDRAMELEQAAARIRDCLQGGVLWHVNSTAAGGGIAEMLRALLPLYESLGVRVGWMVIGGDGRFFTLTKRLGAALYGWRDDRGSLGAPERAEYMQALAANADEIRSVVGPKDILLLHDHQTGGLVELLHRELAAVYWRCHVGVDEPNDASEEAWAFLAPLLEQARGAVFSVAGHVPDVLRHHRLAIIPPFISPFSLKNCEVDPGTVTAALVTCGLYDDNGSTAMAEAARPIAPRHRVRVISEACPRPDVPLLVQVSRWDRLKDMDGVLTSFASFVDEGYLALVGPDPNGIPDDVEQHEWFGRCLRAWQALPAAQRARSALICLPMDDLDENALLVNAIQRSADIVLQKSLAEGFGLTVTEAMWKSRPVVASAVGGIRTQITHGHDGLLVDDPTDLSEFGALAASLLKGDTDGNSMARRGHRKVLRDFLADREIVATAHLLTDDPPAPLIDIGGKEKENHDNGNEERPVSAGTRPLPDVGLRHDQGSASTGQLRGAQASLRAQAGGTS